MDPTGRSSSRWRGLSIVAAAALVGCAAPRDPAAGAARPLLGAPWTLTEIAGQPVAEAASGRTPHLEFARDGARVAGFTGCNNLAGAYSLEGDRLTFPDPLATTRMACLDPEIASQEQAFLDAIRRTSRFTISGDVLTLYDDGQAVARFEADEAR